MSILSEQLSKLGQGASTLVHQPLKGLANIITMGQLSRLRDVYNSSGAADLYNKNKSAILQGAAAAALGAATGGLGAAALEGGVGYGAAAGGLAGAAAGGLSGHDVDVARAEHDLAVQKQNTASSNLNNILKGIGGDPTQTQPTVGTQPTTGYPTGAYVMNPVTGTPVASTEPDYQTLVNSGQVPFINGQPVLTGATPVNVGIQPTGSTPINKTTSDIGTTFAQQDPQIAARLGQIIGTGTDAAHTSANQLLNLNDLQTQLGQQTLDQQAAARKQQISDLSNLLTQQAQTQYERNLPGLYEDLNTRGLLRSSDLGNQMALREQQSYQDVANQLAQQQLAYNDQYISGLGNVSNQYSSGLSSALGRELSLQDYANQIAASKELGQAVAPVQPYGGKSGSSAATTGLGIANAASSLGQTVGKKTA